MVTISYEIPHQFVWDVWEMDRKHKPQVRLPSTIYEAWLKEDPKDVDGGPIELTISDNPIDSNDVYFRARRVRTSKLPIQYAEKMMIYSRYTEYAGAMFHVGPQDPWDFMLAAHQLHTNGIFFDANGKKHGNVPHYHEWDYFLANPDGSPSKRNKVPSSLRIEMQAHELLDVFLNDYHFNDGRTNPISPPRKPKHWQERI